MIACRSLAKALASWPGAPRLHGLFQQTRPARENLRRTRTEMKRPGTEQNKTWMVACLRILNWFKRSDTLQHAARALSLRLKQPKYPYNHVDAAGVRGSVRHSDLGSR